MGTTTETKTPMKYPHPLDPLTGEELKAVVELLRSSPSLSEKIRFGSIVLKEPSKAAVLEWTPESDPLEREAFCILLDNDENKTMEAVVSLTSSQVVSLEHIPGVQPAIMLDEFPECEATIKKSELFRAALAKRGITNVDLVMVDPWSAGYYGGDKDERRLVRALCWMKASPTDNGYARPIEGVVPVVDLNKMEVITVEDYGVVPLPPNDGNYTPEFVKDLRTDIKPIEILQPQGPSFTVQGQQISWQKWKVRVGFTPREGLVLHQCSYTDNGVERPIFYRASLSEMTVPYADPLPQSYRKNAFDVGEYNLGTLTNSLKLGCDCLGEIYYFDATMIGSRGDVCAIDQAVCLHEEDAGILWKHMDWRTEQTEVRRSRRLVVSFIATVGNYEYGYYW
jgi:primary-amine oxidase